MKILSKAISAMLVLLLMATMFVGCSTHKYELVGIILNSGDTEITLIDQIQDEEIKEYLTITYGNNCYIDLNQDHTFSMGYSLTENGLTITYEQVGEYELKEDESTIIFYTPTSTGEKRPTTQQYLNGKIIYYDGVVFLAFK